MGRVGTDKQGLNYITLKNCFKIYSFVITIHVICTFFSQVAHVSNKNKSILINANEVVLHIIKCSTVWMSNFGSIDLKGLTQSVTKKDINRIHCLLLEEMMSEIRLENKRSLARGGGNITRQTMIYDMHNLSYKQITSKCGRLQQMDVKALQIYLYYSQKVEFYSYFLYN